jgi:hypothetical protein
MKTDATVETLRSHPLVHQALIEAVKTQKSLNDRHPVKVNPHYERDPDEHEFFLIGVGHALAELLNLCEQLSHIGVYMARFSSTPATRAAGITRDKHLLYHIENHLIRLHATYDRCLLVVDAIFHLLNAATAISQPVIASNLKVARTSIPKKLKAIRKVLAPTIDTRNDVIHHHAYKEDLLRELEMFCLADNVLPHEQSGPLSQRYIRSRIRELTRDLVKKKTNEFAALNAALFAAIAQLLTDLQPIYAKEMRLVKARVNAET